STSRRLKARRLRPRAMACSAAKPKSIGRSPTATLRTERVPEQEELKLVVTLDDQASASLARLRGELQNFNAPVGSGRERVAPPPKETAAETKLLHTEMNMLASRAGFIGGIVGGVTSELTKMGIELAQRATDLRGFSEQMVKLSQASYSMGVST